jgi:energy-coupling factor transporter ATP-binding protein EcfA2
MRILATADIHIHDFLSHTKLVAGIPTRLLVFKSLAEHIVSIAKDNNVDIIVVAGDSVVSPICSPSVHKMVSIFYNILSSDFPVHVIDGQHDINTKVDNSREFWSVLTSKSIDRNFCYHDNEIVDIGGLSFYFKGWSASRPVLLDADVFVGHGMVLGAEDAKGYKFRNGFQISNLDKYKLSIIGDIHKGQVVGGKILIPGPPIMQDIRDDRTTGVWIVDIGDGITPEFEFVPIVNDIYKVFIEVDEETDVEYPPNYVVTSKGPKKKPAVKKDDGAVVREYQDTGVDLKSLSISLLSGHKGSFTPDEYELIEKKIDYYCSTVKPAVSVSKPEVEIAKVELHNFGSIKHQVVDFDEMDVDSNGVLLLLGSTGSGKSSLLEGISWCLYEELSTDSTNKALKDDIIYDEGPCDGTYVLVTLRINGSEYLVRRSRGHVEHGSTLVIIGPDKEPIRLNKVSDTQEYLVKLLGFTQEEFGLLYFSQRKFSFFNELKPSIQMEIFRALGDFSLVEGIEKAIANDLSVVDKGIKTLSVARSNSVSNIETLKRILLNSQKPKDPTEIIGKLRKLVPLLPEDLQGVVINDYLLTQLVNLGLTTEHGKSLKSVYDVEKAVSYFEIKMLDFARAIEDKELELRNIATSCPYCNQEMPSKSIESKKIALADYIKDYRDKLIRLTQLHKLYQSQVDIIDEVSRLTSELTPLLAQQGNIEAIQKSIDEETTKLKETEASLKREELLSKVLDFLTKKIFSNKGVYAHLMTSLGSDIEERLNLYLENSPIAVKLSTVEYTSKGTIIPGITLKASKKKGPFRSYHRLSGGESRLVDLALMIVLNNKLAERHKLINGAFGMLLLDEVVLYFDAEFIETATSLLDRSKAKKKVLVTHETRLIPFFNRVLSAKLEKETGTIYRYGDGSIGGGENEIS